MRNSSNTGLNLHGYLVVYLLGIPSIVLGLWMKAVLCSGGIRTLRWKRQGAAKTLLKIARQHPEVVFEINLFFRTES